MCEDFCNLRGPQRVTGLGVHRLSDGDLCCLKGFPRLFVHALMQQVCCGPVGAVTRLECVLHHGIGYRHVFHVSLMFSQSLYITLHYMEGIETGDI